MTTCLVKLTGGYGFVPATGGHMAINRINRADDGEMIVTTGAKSTPITYPFTSVPLEQGVEYAFTELWPGGITTYKLIPATVDAEYRLLEDVIPVPADAGFLGDAFVTGLVDNPVSTTHDAILAMVGDVAGMTDETVADLIDGAGPLTIAALDADYATTASLAAKAPLASPAFTGTPTGITKAHVGLGSVDNTTDAAKLAAAAALIAAQSTTDDGKYGTLANVALSVKPRAGTALTAAPLPYVNVRDYGAVGNGTTDDSAAIQAAIDAAGVGGKTLIPPGVYKCLTGLTTPTFSTLEGQTIEFGVGGTGTTELRFNAFTAAEVGIALGANSSLRNIIVRGPGEATGTCIGVTGASVRVERVTFGTWKTAVKLTAGYYAQFHEANWQYNGTALNLVGCYNVNLYAPEIQCRNPAGTAWGIGITADTVRALNIFGGSIEAFGSSGGIALTAGGNGLNIFGTYFESSDVASAAFGILAAGLSANSITVQGCLVYLTNMNRWVHVGTSTTTTLVGIGNKFVCSAASVGAPQAYVLPGAGNDVFLKGDNWANAPAPASYVGGALNSGAVLGYDITKPAGAGADNSHYLGRGFVFPEARDITFGTATGTKIGTTTSDKMGFWGKTPVVRPSAYTNTYATADKTLAAYTADPETSAYTGAADSEAKLVDLNALRVAYENLRLFTEDLAQQHNSLIADMKVIGVIG